MAQSWIKMTPDSVIPPSAVIAEPDCHNGFPTYVGRASHEGGTFPARVDSKNNCAYISYGGSQIKKTDYEVLLGENYKFVNCSGDCIPMNAVRAGNTADGEPLWVGRGIVEGNPILGKIHPIHQCLFVPFGGEEHRLYSYEALVRQSPAPSLQSNNCGISSQLDNHTENTVVYTGTPSASKISVVEPPPPAIIPQTVPTANEDTGPWKTLDWDKIEEKAVFAGIDNNTKNEIYVGRAEHNGEILPAKLIPKTKEVFVSCDGQEIPKTKFQALVDEGYSWKLGEQSGDNIPERAVSTGLTKDGKPVYVGRAVHSDTLTPGKVNPGICNVSIPFNQKEHKISDRYEILVKNLQNPPLYSDKWVDAKLDNIPQNAVIGGLDKNKAPIYVGRSYNLTENLPANVSPAKGRVSVSWSPKEIWKDKFAVLVGDGYTWVRGKKSGDNIPAGAVSTGKTSNGKPVYVGRALYKNALILGKVHPDSYAVYIPYEGKEEKISNYEILIKKN